MTHDIARHALSASTLCFSPSMCTSAVHDNAKQIGGKEHENAGRETKCLKSHKPLFSRKFFKAGLPKSVVLNDIQFASWWEMAANEECEPSILFGQCSLCRCVQTHRHHHLTCSFLDVDSHMTLLASA
jgi:hypothetical protein